MKTDAQKATAGLDLIFSSPSQRTRQTFELIFPNKDDSVIYTKIFYLGNMKMILSILRSLEPQRKMY